MQTDLYYVQVHIEEDSYWYTDTKELNWISSRGCANGIGPTAVDIFKAKQIILRDKEEEKAEAIYYIIPTTSSPIQIIK